MIINTTSYRSPNYDARPTQPPDAIVVHSTQGLWDSDARWLCNPQSQVSSHYIINPTGGVYQLVDDVRRAWHAGNSEYNKRYSWNDFSIGIELSYPVDGKPSQAQNDSLIALCRSLIAEYGIKRENVVLHRWIAMPRGRKTDPDNLTDKQFTIMVDQMYSDFYGLSSPLVGLPKTDVVQCVSRIIQCHKRKNGTTYDDKSIETIVRSYWSLCSIIGLDPVIVLAQMCHETGCLTEFWSQQPQRNPAGIGVTGESSSKPQPGFVWNPVTKRYEKGLSFPSWDYFSIPAHVGRLLAYVYATPLNLDQSSIIAQALAYRDLAQQYRGSVSTIKDLTGRWATDPNYSNKIVEYANYLAQVVV